MISLKIWPKGSNFNNRLVHMSTKINEHIIIFCGYMTTTDEDDMLSFFKDMELEYCLLEQSDSISRKSSSTELQGWCAKREIQLTKFTEMFKTEVKLASQQGE